MYVTLSCILTVHFASKYLYPLTPKCPVLLVKIASDCLNSIVVQVSINRNSSTIFLIEEDIFPVTTDREVLNESYQKSRLLNFFLASGLQSA